MNLFNKLVLFFTISFSILISHQNIFSLIDSNRECEGLSEDECFVAENCLWDEEEGCYRPSGGGIPECLQDCPGVDDINPQENPDETCDWVVSTLSFVDPGFASCFSNCDEETTNQIYEVLEACYECLQSDNIECSDVFNDGNGCEGLTQEECADSEFCAWSIVQTPNGVFEICIDSENMDDGGDDGSNNLCSDIDNPYECYNAECEWMSNTPFGDFGICIEPGTMDDGGNFEGCAELTQDECTENPECDWSIVTTPNGVFEMCIDVNDWNDDGGWQSECEGLSYEDCEYLDFCEWISDSDNPNNTGFCIDAGGPNPCSDFNQEDCEWYDECVWTDQGCQNYDWNDDGGWDDGGSNLCSDIDNPFECYGSGCSWELTASGEGYCIEVDDEDCNPDSICGEAITCIDGLLYPTTCGPDNCDLPIGVCDEGEDDGGNNIICSDINNPFECIGSGCDWVGGNMPGQGYCVEESDEDCNPDLMCGGAITCVDGLLYPTTCGPDNCDLPIGECEEDECENGEINNENPCNPFECFDGQWYEIVIDCAEEMGVPCVNGEYVDPPEGECCSICVEYNDAPDAILFLDNSSAIPNSEISIPLYIGSNEPIAGLQFEIHSPLNSGGNGGFINPSSIESIFDCFNTEFNVIDNTLIVIMFSLEACVIPNGENHIANINYYIPESVDLGQNIPLEFGNTIVSDQFGNEIPSAGESGSILVGMAGDINGDGQVNVSDIVLAVSFAISSQTPTPYQLWAGDVNDDGMVNVLDIVTIVNMILN
jgi:hypothetical protein